LAHFSGVNIRNDILEKLSNKENEESCSEEEYSPQVGDEVSWNYTSRFLVDLLRLKFISKGLTEASILGKSLK
jgi:hypothetical protein